MHDALHINGALEHSPGADMVGAFLNPDAWCRIKVAASSRYWTA
jgi:hypothetical protein